MNKTEVMVYIKDIAKRLKDPKAYGGVSLMVGAGFSRNAESIGYIKEPPNWNQLANCMYQELYPKPENDEKRWETNRSIKISGKNVLRLAEEYIAFFDRDRLNSLIERSIADNMFRPGELHKRLLKQNWMDVFTTNYDTLLERTMESIIREREYRIIATQDSLPGSGGQPRLVKLHGSIPDVKPYIISEEDYRSYPQKYTAFVNTVQQAMIETTLCLIGFSGDDPNFLSWHGWLRDNLGDNCPQIYLIGLFDNISEPEKRTIQNQKIAIIDLSVFLEGKEEDKFEVAYNRFLDEVEKLQKEENCFDSRPYENFNWDSRKETEYVNTIYQFSEKILEEIKDLILLPLEQMSKYRDYFADQFDILLYKCKKYDDIFYKALGNIVYILRIVLRPLYDPEASIVENIIKNAGGIDKEVQFLLDLYLLEMYRIDGKDIKYENTLMRCETYINSISIDAQALFGIEKAKYAMAQFEESKVHSILEKVSSSNIFIRIAKAELYNQIGKRDVATEIIDECLKEIGHSIYPVNLYASYKSYLSLCSIPVYGWLYDDNLSDSDCKDNKYRIRKIISEFQNSFMANIMKENVKVETRKNVFDVNYHREHHRLAGKDIVQEMSFNFILLLDRLCLPVFTDQKSLLIYAIDKITDTSDSAYWKETLLARSNDKEIIEIAFSRDRISSKDTTESKILFDKLFACAKRMDLKKYDNMQFFFSLKNVTDILSRLVVYQKDDDIIDFVKFLCKIDVNDKTTLQSVMGRIRRVSTRFNTKIANELVDEIFTIADYRLNIPYYFSDIKFSIKKSDKFYSAAIKLIASHDVEERDCGIGRIILLWKNCIWNKYKDKIIQNIWRNNTVSFPDETGYYPVIWMELPYPDEVDLGQLYSRYILDGINNASATEDIFPYVNAFCLYTGITGTKYRYISPDKEYADNLFNAIKNYVNKFDSNDCLEIYFENIKKPKEQANYFQQMIACIYALFIATDLEAYVEARVQDILKVFKEKGYIYFVVNRIDEFKRSEYPVCINAIREVILSDNKKELYQDAFLGIQCLYYILTNREIEDKQNILKQVDDLITQTSHIKNGVRTLKNQYFSS